MDNDSEVRNLNTDESKNIEFNQKRAISTLIELAILIQKRGGLTVFQARDVCNAVDVFTSDENQPRSQEDQLNSIKTLIEVAHIGQNKGVVELNEAKVIANIIDVLGNNEKLKEMSMEKELSLSS